MTRVVVVLLLLTAPARADVTADVTKDYTAFVDQVATGTMPANVEMMIAPQSDSATTLFDDFKKELPAPKLSNVTVVPAKSGTSAWIVADVTAMLPGKELGAKTVAGTLRTSALLVRDDKGWHVRAAHWSAAKPNQTRDHGCGMLDQEWRLDEHSKVAKDLAPEVRAVFEAIRDDKFASVLSDDKHAITIGSAPNELFTGGAAVKKLFAKWKIHSTFAATDAPLPAVAGITPDKELMWIAMPVMAPAQLCTEYRALYVLQRDGSDWKIVHQHYSNWVVY